MVPCRALSVLFSGSGFSAVTVLGPVRLFAALFLGLGCFLASTSARAAEMFLEYRGELNPGYTFFRGAFDLGDLDRDGADEMVIADDLGGFQVFKFTPEGFEPIWINDPIVDNDSESADGVVNRTYIVSVQILHEGSPRIMPQILFLDSNGTLHQVRYTGYLFEQTATYENFRPPAESGRLVITGVGGEKHDIYLAVQEQANRAAPSSASGSGVSAFEGMKLYRLTTEGLVELSERELGALQEGEVYFVQNLTEEDVRRLQSLGGSVSNMFPSMGPESRRAGMADLDRDAVLELLLAVSDPDRPVDRLEIFKEHDNQYTVRITLELPLMNEMLLGDVDGDGFTEIVGLTFDGEVLVYQWDPLTVRRPDGSSVKWEAPHKEINGTIWMSLGGFEDLGCSYRDDPRYLTVSRGPNSVVLDRANGTLTCNGNLLLPQVPSQVLDRTPYLPLFLTLDCLGFLYSYYPEQCLVQLEN